MSFLLSGNGGKVAPSGGETNDKVPARYNREGHRRILRHRADKLGAGLAGAGENILRHKRLRMRR